LADLLPCLTQPRNGKSKHTNRQHLSKGHILVAARKAIETGDVRRAQELAEEAETVCSTEKGRELRLLSSWLLSSSGRN
jgi:hypothetical protein